MRVYVLLMAIILGGCVEQSAYNPQTQLKNDGGTWRVKPGSVHDGDTFRAIGLTGEEVKVRMACIDAV